MFAFILMPAFIHNFLLSITRTPQQLSMSLLKCRRTALKAVTRTPTSEMSKELTANGIFCTGNQV